MTRVDRSGRYSARVVVPGAAATDERATGALSAPGNLTRSSGETNAPAERRGHPSAERVSDQQLLRLHARLSSRDLAILDSVATYKFLTTTQLRDFHFHDHATLEAGSRVCRRVLLRLRRHGVLEELDRRVGGLRAGSDAFIWRIGKLGDRLRRLDAGHGARARRKEPSERFLDHCLDIAGAHLQLLGAARRGELELVRVTTEPHTWRPYLGPSGERLTLKPDLLMTTAVGEFADDWAMEIDEGSQSIPTLIKKCVQYEAYRATGRAQAEQGVFPLVIWIVPTQHRADRLREAIDRSPRLDHSLYRVCTPDGLLAVVQGGAA